jgi:hypothetical protein
VTSNKSLVWQILQSETQLDEYGAKAEHGASDVGDDLTQQAVDCGPTPVCKGLT